MVVIQGFHGGMGDISTLLGANQFDYAENLHVRNPEFVTLAQKPESVISTGTKLMYATLNNDYYGEDGFVYDENGINVLQTTNGLDIVSVGQTTTDLYFFQEDKEKTGGDLGTVSVFAGSLADRSTHASYNENLANLSGTNHAILDVGRNLRYTDSSSIKQIDDSGVISTLASFGATIVGISAGGTSYKVYSRGGKMFIWDGASSTPDATINRNMPVRYIMSEGLHDYIVGGRKTENSVLMLGSGYDKVQLTRRITNSNIEDKVKFAIGTDNAGGSQMSDNFGGLTFMVADNKILSFGTQLRGLPQCFNYPIATNSAGNPIDRIGFAEVKRDFPNEDMYLYYSWHDGTNAGIDRVKLNDIDPDSFQNTGVMYSQKFTNEGRMLSIDNMKTRCETSAGQTITISVSEDGGAYRELATLDESNSESYTLIDSHAEGFELQFKFEFTTNDSTQSPKLYSFEFIPSVLDA